MISRRQFLSGIALRYAYAVGHNEEGLHVASAWAAWRTIHTRVHNGSSTRAFDQTSHGSQRGWPQIASYYVMPELRVISVVCQFAVVVCCVQSNRRLPKPWPASSAIVCFWCFPVINFKPVTLDNPMTFGPSPQTGVLGHINNTVHPV